MPFLSLWHLFVDLIRGQGLVRKKSKWKTKLLAALALLAISVCVGGYFLKRYVTPTVREAVERPLYTVGDENYKRALADGMNIVKFGRLPFGIYPGGVAFDDITSATEHLKKIGKSNAEWKVYLLSGDFEIDTVLVGEQHYTNKSLLVIEEVLIQSNPIELDYKTFDQTPNSGWRLLADEKKYSEAAEMIDNYISDHTELELQQVRILNFHAGQMYAFDGDYENAESRFKLSLLDEEPADSPIRWNAYVTATIGFLNNDKPTLEKCRAEIFEGPRIAGEVPNLNVVDSLIHHLGQPYSIAYESQRGMKDR